MIVFGKSDEKEAEIATFILMTRLSPEVLQNPKERAKRARNGLKR